MPYDPDTPRTTPLAVLRALLPWAIIVAVLVGFVLLVLWPIFHW